MKTGDVCRCISEFTGVLPEELTVYKNDILQIHSIVDRHWVEAEGGGLVGRVPSSVLVQTEVPKHPQGTPLFVAAADFHPSQAGDLGFARGDFIIGLNPIDEAWWCGEIFGKKGIFPVNFVWKINEDILEDEDTTEKAVCMKARVKMSIRAQLPEELDLYAGDIVNITHVVDKDWYRGESNGSKGIFPKDFVEVVETSSVPSPSFTQPVETNQEYIPSADCTDLSSGYQTNIPENTIASTNVPYDAIDSQMASDVYDAGLISCTSAAAPVPSSNPPANLSKTSAHWKTIDATEDLDILEDDYFKQNMPGLFSSSSNKSMLRSQTDAQAIIPPLNQASASDSFTNMKPRYENVLSSLPSEASSNSFTLDNESYPASRANTHLPMQTGPKHRYENVNENECVKTSVNRYENAPITDANGYPDDCEQSALDNVQDANVNGMLNSISQKVDDYLCQDLENKISCENNNNSKLIKQYSTMSSPGYNEDNTGIEPYGRAVFSFKAQYPNELTFRKGDIIHLLRHIDSHWTLGRLGDTKGIFPTSYVDIIVNCLYNEEELFLSRNETVVQSSYLGYAKAEYSFEAIQSADISMTKGDILKVIKYIDDNWVIVEHVNGSKGMCPQNYLSMLSDLTAKPQETSSLMPETLSDNGNDREPRQLSQSKSSSRSRSTSPYNTSGVRRSYNKEDFGSIKQQEVDSVLAKNIASLDVACKSTHIEKKSGESIFTEREISQETPKPETAPPIIPPRLARIPSGNMKSKETVSRTPSLPPKPSNVPPIPPRIDAERESSMTSKDQQDVPLGNTNNSLNDDRGASKPNIVPFEGETKPPVEPIYSKVQKPSLAGKPSANRPQLRITRKESGTGTTPLARGDSASSASFPDDVSSVSLNSEGTYSSEAHNGNTSPAVLPQRPAPPPPPKVCEYDEVEEYYSLPPEVEKEVTCTSLPSLQMDSPTVNRVEDAPAGGVDAHYDVVEEDITNQEQTKATAKVDMRRELMQEIVTTEHEYIHDLEALIQVIRLAPSQKEAQTVDLNTLMGNISQVVSIAKKLLSHLDSVAYEDDENLLIGRVFLLCAPDLCEVYKMYCSNHNVAAEPLLRKYQEEEEPAAFLKWVLSELQQHKIQLMDMRSVLIKPVQRVLKYPLFLDRLVSETPRNHADYQDLMEAKAKMANVAKEINEYTKRLDLINKYRNAADQSLQSKMQRVSMHSVAKKSARLSAIVSEKLGIMTTTKDPDFDEEETKFRFVERAALALMQDVAIVLQSIKARHKTELEIAKALAAVLIEGARSPAMEAVQRTTLDSCNRLLQMFEIFVNKRITQPASQLVSLCEVPERLIAKRYHKLLDFDNAQYKLDRNKDPTRTRILEEELSQAKGNYEALNTQLMMELPVLTSAGTEIISLSTRSLVSVRMYLQGHLAKLYLQLAQIPGLSYSGDEEMLAQFRVKYLQQVGEFRHLSFIPSESLQRSLPRPKPRGKRSLDNTVPKNVPEGPKKKVLGKYPAELVFIVAEVHTPGEVMELTLYPGDHVALLKNKDPLGKSDRWFVDDGDNKGFVRAMCLKPLNGTDSRAAIAAAVPPSTSTAALPHTQPNPSAAPRPSTLPRAAPNPPLPERPPRYEDLFPNVNTAAPRPRRVVGYNPNGRHAPPPRYSMGQEVNVLPAQTPLPSKPGCREQQSSVVDHQVSEIDHYSPPLDRQQSNEYNSPVSEESNIYEEIDQKRGETPEKSAVEVEDGSPIYEVIRDPSSTQEPHHNATGGASPLPEPECDEPQFYYALYNFGGSDCTQLNLTAGQVVLIVEAKSSDWWFVEDRNSNQGYVPASYLTKYT